MPSIRNREAESPGLKWQAKIFFFFGLVEI